MPDEPAAGPLGTELRRVTFPDGASGVIAVRPGLSQDRVDLLAAQLWSELPNE